MIYLLNKLRPAHGMSMKSVPRFGAKLVVDEIYIEADGKSTIEKLYNAKKPGPAKKQQKKQPAAKKEDGKTKEDK